MFSRLKFAFDKNLTVSNVLDKSVAAYGEDFVLLTFGGTQKHIGIGGNSITLGELRDVVNRLSNYLVKRGIQRFDRVAICKKSEIDYLIVSLAIFRCGAISVPINGSMSSDNLHRFIKYTGAKLVFSDETTIHKIESKADGEGNCQSICATPGGLRRMHQGRHIDDRLSDESAAFEAVNIHAKDDVLIVHTSGTTGFPKGVLHGSRSLVLATQAQLKLQPITNKNKYLLASPANHHISQASIIASLAAGMPTYVPSGESPTQLLETIGRERISLMLAFPDIYAEMCSLDLTNYDLSSMKIWMAGGDSSHEPHIRKLTNQGSSLRLFNKRILSSAYIEFFGTSEIGFAALMKVSFSFTNRFRRCVGKPTLYSPKVKVADSEGRRVPLGVPGRLMVKGPTLFKGYWNAHDKLHGVYIDQWWWTGDVAYKDKLGRYYHLDREVDAICTNEGTVYSLPIEELLIRHPALFEVVVVSQKEGDSYVPLIIVQPRAGETISEQQIRNLLRQEVPELTNFKVRVLREEDRIPRGLTGKVLKRELRTMLEGNSSAPNILAKSA